MISLNNGQLPELGRMHVRLRVDMFVALNLFSLEYVCDSM